MEIGVAIVLIGWMLQILFALLFSRDFNIAVFLLITILGSVFVLSGFLSLQANRILKVASKIPSPVVTEKTKERGAL